MNQISTRDGVNFTYGSAQCAINLMTILARDEYQSIRDNVLSKLSKQDFRLNQVMSIDDRNIRDTTLLMWHDRFKDAVKIFPELIRTHVLCVETSIFRKLLRKSHRMNQ